MFFVENFGVDEIKFNGVVLERIIPKHFHSEALPIVVTVGFVIINSRRRITFIKEIFSVKTNLGGTNSKSTQKAIISIDRGVVVVEIMCPHFEVEILKEVDAKGAAGKNTLGGGKETKRFPWFPAKQNFP